MFHYILLPFLCLILLVLHLFSKGKALTVGSDLDEVIQVLAVKQQRCTRVSKLFFPFLFANLWLLKRKIFLLFLS